MHDTAHQIGGLAMQLYCDLNIARILEIGSQNVNGTLRDFALPGTSYVGLDIEQAPGVDLVMEPGKPFPVADDAFDLVMATSVFEHDPAFWSTFVEMCRKAKTGGYVYINAPSNGTFHQYPLDHWRFYPDCGIALVNWAKSQGQEIALVETFVAERKGDTWNDFVGVFRKGGLGDNPPAKLVSDEVACTNVRTWRGEGLERRRDRTEDMQLMKQQQETVRELEGEARLMRQQIGDSIAVLERVEQERDTLRRAVETARQQLQEAQNRLATLESTLVQRQEEIAQAYAELAGLREMVQESEARNADINSKRIEADGWVLRLSAERKELATQVERLERKLGETDKAQRIATAAHEREREAFGRELHDREQEVAAMRAEAQAMEQRLTGELEAERARAKAELQGLRTEKGAVEGRLTERFSEIAAITRLLSEKESSARLSEEQVTWLREVSAVLLSNSNTMKGRLLALMPASVRYGKLNARLKRKGVFDPDAYLAAYPDVAETGMDPLRHYILHGIGEGRQVASVGN